MLLPGAELHWGGGGGGVHLATPLENWKKIVYKGVRTFDLLCERYDI